MKRIRKKLNSQQGASITWALLIFLVCAVVGSAVLVAGTAASGRMSKIAENDQRYYAVNSAARLLCKIIPEEELSIVKKVDASGNNVYYVNGSSSPYIRPASFDSLPVFSADLLGYLGGTIPTTSVQVEFDLTTTLLGADQQHSSVPSVTINETAFVDGRLVFVISKEQGTSTYKLRLTFDIEEPYKSNNPRVDDRSDDPAGLSYTLKWKLVDVESVR